jgi:hypothetical protein
MQTVLGLGLPTTVRGNSSISCFKDNTYPLSGNTAHQEWDQSQAMADAIINHIYLRHGASALWSQIKELNLSTSSPPDQHRFCIRHMTTTALPTEQMRLKTTTVPPWSNWHLLSNFQQSGIFNSTLSATTQQSRPDGIYSLSLHAPRQRSHMQPHSQ